MRIAFLVLFLCACHSPGVDSSAPVDSDPPTIPDDTGTVATPAFAGDYPAGQASVRLYATEPQQHAGRVLAVGDVDGDGVEELVVTTVRDEDYQGGAWLMHNLPEGSGTFPEHGLRFEGDTSTLGAGRAASLGDIDGDGLADLLLSAPYAGSSALLLTPAPFEQDIELAEVTMRFEGVDGATTGHDAQLVDMNADGLADVVAGAPGSFGSDDAGSAMLVYAPFDDGTSSLALATDASFAGAEPGDGAGRTLRAGGDVDGDGLADLLVGAPYADRQGTDRGVVHLLLGPFEGASDMSDARAELQGENPGDLAGLDLALADVDGDGRADPVVGAQGSASSFEGVVYVLTSVPVGALDLGAAELEIRGEQPGWGLGWALAARDIDADGRAELLLGALAARDGEGSPGAAYLFDDPEPGAWSTADATARVIGETDGAYTGMGVALGDLDGDGLGDLIVGAALEASGGEAAGAVYVQLSGVPVIR
jgi:hypothetical protein